MCRPGIPCPWNKENILTPINSTRNYFAACLLAIVADAFPGVVPDPPQECPQCEEWNQPQEPFRIHGRTYYVGTEGLTSVLVAGQAEDGRPVLALIDGALPQSAPLIEANIRSLGFEVTDIRYILNSHAHFDHAGGINALQRASGAEVVVSEKSLPALRSGQVTSDDPQAGFAPDHNFPPVSNLQTISDGGSINLGDTTLTIHYTPGHTPGSSSWSWQSCDDSGCVNVLYADSMSAVSAEGFRFSDPAADDTVALNAADLLRQSIDFVRNFDCGVLLSSHPGNFRMAEKLERLSESPDENPFVRPIDCRRYADVWERYLDRRLQEEATLETG